MPQVNDTSTNRYSVSETSKANADNGSAKRENVSYKKQNAKVYQGMTAKILSLTSHSEIFLSYNSDNISNT